MQDVEYGVVSRSCIVVVGFLIHKSQREVDFYFLLI